MKKKTAIVTGLTITGVATLIGAGFVLNKKRKKSKELADKVVCEYDELHNNSRLNKSIDEGQEEDTRKWIKLR
ncbi:MAG: LPXTG cell wall anchor domain-containing protein [Firmicutes bacterium]|nr:LPXTG cell wall anchor domain-containing protein [Bacillota bacterium]